MTPRTVQELTAGDYLQVAVPHHGAWSYDHDEQYALIERIETSPPTAASCYRSSSPLAR